ncbi:sugar transporter [Aeribacillus composti]|uniref:sugar transporter n=1 Tax=Aeribacillus composti TaxID=1868734 RepID=UPI002E1AFE49|nr:sugar transporter [Aeribacillus composti]
MKYFKYKRLIKKRKAISNIEIFYRSIFNEFSEADKKILLSVLYKINQVINFMSKIAPIFVYSLIYYFHSYLEPFINPLYVATIYLIFSLWSTDINNDDYDPQEMENVSEWMYKARKNKFKLLILERLALTFGTSILFYCIFIFIYMEKMNVSYVIIFLYEIFGIIAAVLTILLKFYWSNHQILFLFFHGPNDMKRKEHFIRYQYDPQLDKYLIALSRSVQNRTYYLYIFYIYLFAAILPFIIWFITYHFGVHQFIILTVYLAVESVMISFISQGIINSSKMLNNSNLSDYYYIKKFDKKKYYENLLSKFLSRKLFVILLSYYLGLFVLYGFSSVTAIIGLCSTVIYFSTIQIITKRVFRFKKLSLEEIKDNFFIYFFSPIEDLFIIGFPLIISSAVAIYSIKSGSVYHIIMCFFIYSIFLLFYNFLKER